MGWQDAPLVAQGDAQAATLPAVPEWQRAPLAEPAERVTPPLAAGQNLGTKPTGKVASGPWEAFLAGWQGSGPGLFARGKLPDLVLDASQSKWYERAIAGTAQVVAEIPEMALGGAFGSAAGTVAGGPVGSILGGGAGMFAVPGMIREMLIQGYQGGDVTSAADFLNRTRIILQTTAKEAAVGALTAGMGAVASRVVGAAVAPMIGDIGVKTATRAINAADTAAQVGTMVVAPAALEGRLPEPHEIMDAAIVIAGMKAAAHVAPKIAEIYARTGRTPAEVVADANADPGIKADLLSQAAGPASLKAPESALPAAYKPLADAERAAMIVPGEKAAQVAVSPFADSLPQVKGEPARPTHVNYNYINTTEDAKLAMARLSQVYEGEIQAQRRGTVSWAQTEAEAGDVLTGMLGGKIEPRAPGTPAGAAELLARKQLVTGAAEDMMAARDNLLARGAEATPADTMAFLQAIERSAMIQSEFLGARAEAGRALNILKSTASTAERARLVNDVIATYGKNPLKLAEMLKQIDTPEGALKFAREAVKATTWEKVVEAWKAGLLSGPVTHVANILGNSTFAVLRAPIDAVAAGVGMLRGGAPGERVALMEPVARVAGLIEGSKDGLRVGWAALQSEDALSAGKSEQFKHAIEGKKGEIIRLPFRALSAQDAVFSTMNQRAEAYALATRQAAAEHLDPLSREFRERVVSLVHNPPAKMAEQIEAAGSRLTFNAPLGEAGAAAQQFVRKWHLEWAVPFVRTPANIAKELLRMSPFAPFIGEWREAIAKGGAERDKAIAEIAVGSATMAAVASFAFDGSITGAGDPDPGKRRAQLAAGWQPYSLKIGDTYYSYQRLQPLGTLVGMAADMAAIWDHLTEEESDKLPKMLSVAFANAVTNQTFLLGITNVVQVLADPVRYGPNFVHSLAGSLVPNIVAQPTAMADPLAREIDSITDAVKSRLPGFRQSLLPKRDIFGEPIAGKERLGGIAPITETKVSDDKVRTEAARIGFSASDAPKKTHIGAGTGKIGDVKLDPDERDVFAETGGKMAHNLLKPIVESDAWDSLPEVVKLATYRKAFTAAHQFAAFQAIPMEKRIRMSQEITEKFQQQLTPEAPR